MIVEGKVSVNGKIIRELGSRVDPLTDDIRVEGEPVFTAQKPKPQYIALNKPVGYTSTVTDPNAHHTVMELVSQVPGRLYPVGRLDVDSEGLLLLTNDGDFANRLTHPRYHVPKVYEVRVRNFMERETAHQLEEGIELMDGITAPAEMRYIDFDANSQTTLLQITIYEGRNRQVRRMMEAVGHPVRSLVRVKFGNIRLGLLNPGTWRKLSADEVEGLMEIAKATPTPPKEKRAAPAAPWRPPGERDARPLRPRAEEKAEEPVAPPPLTGTDAQNRKVMRQIESRPRPDRNFDGRPPRPRTDRDSEGRPPRSNGTGNAGGRPPRPAGSDRSDRSGMSSRPIGSDRPDRSESRPPRPSNSDRPQPSRPPRPGGNDRPNMDSRPPRQGGSDRPDRSGMAPRPPRPGGPGRPGMTPRPPRSGDNAGQPPRRPMIRPDSVNEATVRPPRPKDSRPPARQRPGSEDGVQPFFKPRPPRPPGKIKVQRPPKPSPPRFRRPDKRSQD